MKSTNSEENVQELVLYGSPSISIAKEDARWQGVSCSTYSYKTDEELLKKVIQDKLKLTEKEVTDPEKYKKEFIIREGQRYYHRDNQGEAYWIPIFSVWQKGKARIVFDVAAKTHGVCMNNLRQRPDQNNSILGVLLKLRRYPYAITADIENIFIKLLFPTPNEPICAYSGTMTITQIWCPASGKTEKSPGKTRKCPRFSIKTGNFLYLPTAGMLFIGVSGQIFYYQKS